MQTSILVFALLGIAVFLVRLFRGGRGQAKVVENLSLVQLPHHVGLFLHEGAEGSTFFLAPNGLGWSIRFRLANALTSSGTIEVRVPLDEFGPGLEALLENQGYGSETMSEPDVLPDTERRYLVLTIRGHRFQIENEALHLVCLLFSALGLEPGHRYSVRFHVLLDFQRAIRPFVPTELEQLPMVWPTSDANQELGRSAPRESGLPSSFEELEVGSRKVAEDPEEAAGQRGLSTSGHDADSA